MQNESALVTNLLLHQCVRGTLCSKIRNTVGCRKRIWCIKSHYAGFTSSMAPEFTRRKTLEWRGCSKRSLAITPPKLPTSVYRRATELQNFRAKSGECDTSSLILQYVWHIFDQVTLDHANPIYLACWNMPVMLQDPQKFFALGCDYYRSGNLIPTQCKGFTLMHKKVCDGLRM